MVYGEEKIDRYPLAIFDFEEVKIPMVICIWLVVASISKISGCL